MQLRVTRPVELRYLAPDGQEWLLEIEIETDPNPGDGDGKTIPVTLTPVYTEPEWDTQWPLRHFVLAQPQLIGLDLRVHTRRYRVTRQPSNHELWG